MCSFEGLPLECICVFLKLYRTTSKYCLLGLLLLLLKASSLASYNLLSKTNSFPVWFYAFYYLLSVCSKYFFIFMLNRRLFAKTFLFHSFLWLHIASLTFNGLVGLLDYVKIFKKNEESLHQVILFYYHWVYQGLCANKSKAVNLPFNIYIWAAH